MGCLFVLSLWFIVYNLKIICCPLGLPNLQLLDHLPEKLAKRTIAFCTVRSHITYALWRRGHRTWTGCCPRHPGDVCVVFFVGSGRGRQEPALVALVHRPLPCTTFLSREDTSKMTGKKLATQQPDFLHNTTQHNCEENVCYTQWLHCNDKSYDQYAPLATKIGGCSCGAVIMICLRILNAGLVLTYAAIKCGVENLG